MKKYVFAPHTFALCGLFAFGNLILSSTADSFLPILFSALLSILLMLLAKLLITHYANQKTLFLIVCVLVCVIAAHGVVNTFLEFYNFLINAQLPHTNSFFVLLALLCTVIFFALFRIYAIYKYCLFAAVISGAIIIICFASGIKNYDFTAAKILFTGKLFSLEIFLKYVLLFFVLPFLFYFKNKNYSFKSAITGAIAGFVALLITACQTVFTLGLTTTDFGYLKAISVISTSSLFSRLNGLVFFVCFATCIIKITICIKTIQSVIGLSLNKNPSQN